LCRHKDLIPLDRQLDESVGKGLAAWAAGGALAEPDQREGEASRRRETAPSDVDAGVRETKQSKVAPGHPSSPGSASASSEAETLRRTLRTIAGKMGNLDAVEIAIARNVREHGAESAEHVAWLQSQVTRAEAVV